MDPDVEDAFVAAESGFAVLRASGYAHLGNPERLEVLERLGRMGATIPGIGHELVQELEQQNAIAEVPCGPFRQLLADRLRVRLSTGRGMVAQSLVLGPRTSLGGQVLDPVYPLVAAAERDGLINAEHVTVILRFFAELPSAVSQADRVDAEIQLVEMAKTMRPEMVEAAAKRIMAHLNSDGSLDDERPVVEPESETEPQPELVSDSVPAPPRPRRRASRKCPVCGGNTDEKGAAAPDPGDNDSPSGSDGSDVGGGGAASGTSEPHGRCGGRRQTADRSTPPDDPGPPGTAPPTPPSGSEPVTAQDPELDLGIPPAAGEHRPAELDAAATRDLRNCGQRNMHALQYGLNRLLGDPGLGQHRGLPVTAVITMTIKDLESATGKAISGGGTAIPIRDAIRMAAIAHQYLLVFDEEGRPLYLGRGKRLATADQRLVLYAGDRGCTFPDCPRPGYHSQVHHIEEWAAKNGRTDADLLTLACESHHPLVGPGLNQWATTKAPSGNQFAGRTLWHPPESMDPQ